MKDPLRKRSLTELDDVTTKYYAMEYKKDIYMKTLKEYINLVKSNSFSNAMKKAIAAHERGDKKRARYHLENAKYSLKSTDVNKDPDLHKKYKELRDKYASTGGNFDIKHDMVGSAKVIKDKD